MPFKAIGDLVKAIREPKGILRQIEDITGVAASRISEIENGHAYLGPYAGALAKGLGEEIFALVIREAEMRGLRSAAEVAVDILIARAAPIIGVWNPNSAEGRAEYEQEWRRQMLALDFEAILAPEAVLSEVDKHWSRPATKAGYAGAPEWNEGEIEIVAQVLAKALVEQTALQEKIREATAGA
jgi:transcriptional regulator with XRE-family HTH domain